VTDLWADNFRRLQAAFALVGDPDAVTATYTPSTGPAVTGVKIMIEKSALLEPGGFISSVSAQGIIIEAALDNLGKEPDRGETFTVGSTVYTVLAVQDNDGHTARVHVK